jgi:transposase
MPADQGPPPHDVLAALVVSLRQELAQTRAELQRARERIAELEARLKQNSRNSSRPPSGEGLGKPAPRSLRTKSGRRPGGQAGHEGTTLAQVARPDREVRHEPGGCGRRGAGLAGRPVTGVERRQVFDMPPVMVMVTEHQLVERECACGHRTKGRAPQGAEAPACYGPRIAAIIVYLYIGQFLSKKRTAQALAELFGIPVSSGTVATITGRAAGKLDGFLEHARDQIAASGVAGFDETGFRVAGKLAWVHCARTGWRHHDGASRRRRAEIEPGIGEQHGRGRGPAKASRRSRRIARHAAACPAAIAASKPLQASCQRRAVTLDGRLAAR